VWRAVVRVLRSPAQRWPARALRSPALLLQPPVEDVSCALFPSVCRLCNQPLLHLSASPVCDACWRTLSAQTASLCSLCGEALDLQPGFRRVEAGPASGAEVLCSLCQRARPAFVQAAAYGVYQDTLRALIHLLKYEHVRSVAAPLGALLAQSIAQIASLPRDVTVVAVPLHPRKERQRGFNQTILLAQAAIAALNKQNADVHSDPRLHLTPALRCLGRRRATESQSGLSVAQRRRNLRGAFFASEPERITGRTILLLDDIYTTGATARACTRALLDAGAAAVYVATLARSQRESIALWDAHAPYTGTLTPSALPRSTEVCRTQAQS
jgi:ComF family protein